MQYNINYLNNTMRMNIQKRRKRRRHQPSCCCFLLLFCLPFVSLVFSSGCLTCFVAAADARVRMHHIMQKQRNKRQRGARGDVKRNLTESSSLSSNLSSNSTRWATVIDTSPTISRQQQADERAQWEAAFRAKEMRTEQEIIQQQQDKEILQQPEASPSGRNTDSYIPQSPNTADAEKQARIEAASFVSQLLLQQQQQLQSGFLFSDTATSEIGGLEDVLLQIQRRIWTPLVTPPHILRELNIQPVRGLLLYGKPGCGKSLLARTLGKVLSPLRPVTVVSGPEIMDRYVGSSEKNLRAIFDNPPDLYDFVQQQEADHGHLLSQVALHVIVLDEFDAIARTRGSHHGDQSDAGVARDSLVNQLLSKMDGVDALSVPTLVIGLTNKRSLIEPALLRPGRFEVQLEIPPPRTVQQRVSILRVHMRDMHAAGRLLVSDAPKDSPAQRQLLLQMNDDDGSVPLMAYETLLVELAQATDGFTGASLAGMVRAAASRALERVVQQATTNAPQQLQNPIENVVVTREDLENAIVDVKASLGTDDWEEEKKTETERTVSNQQ